MAIFIAQAEVITVGGVDLSDHATSITVEGTADEVDVTTFQGNGYRSFLIGMKDASITVNFLNDFAAGEVDATLFPLWGSNTPFVVKARPTNAAVSSTNPEYVLTQAVMPNYTPLTGSVGERSETEVVFRLAPGGILDRDVTP